MPRKMSRFAFVFATNLALASLELCLAANSSETASGNSSSAERTSNGEQVGSELASIDILLDPSLIVSRATRDLTLDSLENASGNVESPESCLENVVNTENGMENVENAENGMGNVENAENGMENVENVEDSMENVENSMENAENAENSMENAENSMENVDNSMENVENAENTMENAENAENSMENVERDLRSSENSYPNYWYRSDNRRDGYHRYRERDPRRFFPKYPVFPGK